MPGRSNALAVRVPGAVLGLANEIIHRFTTNLQGWVLECNMLGLVTQTKILCWDEIILCSLLVLYSFMTSMEETCHYDDPADP